MSATDPKNSVFRPLSPDDPVLKKIRVAWEKSAPDRRQYRGTIAEELDHYFEIATSEIGALSYKLQQGLYRPEEIKTIAERLQQMVELSSSIGNYLLKHLL